MDNNNSKDSYLASFVKLFFNTLDLPPYYPVFFFSGILIIVSALSEPLQSFGKIVFLYAIAGIFWRHLTVDLRKLSGIKDSKPITSWQNWVITSIYHIGNIVLLGFIFLWLNVF